MNRKKIILKIAVQTCVCITLTAGAVAVKSSDSQIAERLYGKIAETAGHRITASEVENAGRIVFGQIRDTPARIVSTVIQVNKNSQYGSPIDDETVTENIKQVHSAAGGVVQQVGKNREKGLFVVVRHEGAVSTYGQLEDVNVVPDERVQRGEIIGSYNPGKGKEFYYELKDNM